MLRAQSISSLNRCEQSLVRSLPRVFILWQVVAYQSHVKHMRLIELVFCHGEQSILSARVTVRTARADRKTTDRDGKTTTAREVHARSLCASQS